MRPDLARVVTAYAEDGRTVMSAQALRLRGARPASITAALDARELQRPLKALYVPAQLAITGPLLAELAIEHAGEGAVLTGLMAAEWLGLRWVPEATEAHVLVAHERRRRSTEGRVLVRRCRWVDELDTVLLHGVPVAPVPQVLVDAARELGKREDLRAPAKLQAVRGLVLGAVADRRCTVQEIREVLERSASSGTALVRRACVDAERGCSSPPEAELADALVKRRVAFYVNCEIWVDGVLIGVADVWLVGRGTGGELDSREWHGEEDLLDATLVRHGRFRDATLSLEHITPTRFRQAQTAFLDRLFAEAARRDRLGLAEPAGLVLVPRGPLLP